MNVRKGSSLINDVIFVFYVNWSAVKLKVIKKQVVLLPLPNFRQQVWVSQILGDDHYKGLVRITEGVARLRTFSAQWQWVHAALHRHWWRLQMSEKFLSETNNNKHQTTMFVHTIGNLVFRRKKGDKSNFKQTCFIPLRLFFVPLETFWKFS